MPFIKNNEIKIYYELVYDGNNDKPYLLMNHGNGNSLKDWYSLGYVDALKKDFNLILVDARGFGNSDKPIDPKEYTPEKVTADFIKVLDALKVKSCFYFGNSRGGSMGFLFAKMYPERFKAFCLCSGQPYGSKGPRLSKEFTSWLEQGIEVFFTKVEQALGKSFPPLVKKTLLANDAKAMIAANTPAWPDYSDCFKDRSMPPCLLVVGECDPVAKSNKEFIQKVNNPNVTLKILKGLGHAETYWQGEFIAKIFISYWMQHKNSQPTYQLQSKL